MRNENRPRTFSDPLLQAYIVMVNLRFALDGPMPTRAGLVIVAAIIRSRAYYHWLCRDQLHGLARAVRRWSELKAQRLARVVGTDTVLHSPTSRPRRSRDCGARRIVINVFGRSGAAIQSSGMTNECATGCLPSKQLLARVRGRAHREGWRTRLSFRIGVFEIE